MYDHRQIEHVQQPIGIGVRVRCGRQFGGVEIHVRSLDGKKAWKAVNCRGAVTRGRGESVRLSSCGDGYLFAGQELVWAPATDGGQPWRFAVGDPEPELRKAEDVFHFYTAVIAGPHAFATASDGAVYVFDVAKMGGKAV